jgi:predicted metal-dependent HD superfamily phosphohydrolase
MSDARVTRDRWDALFRDLRCGRPGPAEFERLVRAWREPHRRHHSLAHLEACLGEFDGVRGLAQRPAEAELALWFHDAVWAPRRDDNETRSAAWARRVLRAAVVPDAVGDRIERYIVATAEQADGPEPEGDAALVVDIDRAVLGSTEDDYATYAQSLRNEYRWVPGFLYRRGRRQVLERLLARPRLYATDAFRSRLEDPARRNLEQELAALSGRRSAA